MLTKLAAVVKGSRAHQFDALGVGCIDVGGVEAETNRPVPGDEGYRRMHTHK